jgi:predicted nucleotidyltransferase
MQDRTDPTRLERAARLMRSHGVEFVVIGGQAEYLFGSPRVTYDVDLCYRRSKENLERLASALRELKPTLRGAPPDLPIVLDAKALSLGANYTFDSSLGKLDLLGWVEPLGDYESLIRDAETYTVSDMQLKVISLNDLIRVKEHIGRSKDHSSLVQLLAIKRLRAETGKR